MNVRELIANLLEYDWDAEVNIEIETKENTESISDLDINEQGYGNRKYLEITVKPDGSLLVDEGEFNDLKNEKLDLEDQVDRLNSTVEELQQQIYELESGE